jgi:hypothetical protein
VCVRQQEVVILAHALNSGEPVQCWSCSCGWIGCYTASDIAEYDEPSECQRCYRERLEPCDPSAVRALLPLGSVIDEIAAEIERLDRARPTSRDSGWTSVGKEVFAGTTFETREERAARTLRPRTRRDERPQ